ncbi:hypothetical protein MNBD_GAMMA21-288 [hydrothermal vent metagenome]|uniref:Homoserine dehydrogenase n=1 Tax=hydrothermal vent metagenome TaxID=652676 RepID=A0A3B1B3C9_9ZZZZ
MSAKIKIALLGLGNVGQDFAEAFLEMIQEGGKPIEISAVAHHDRESAVALGFQQNKVPFFDDASGVINMGEEIDIIFDLTGNASTRTELRKGLQDSNNRHTVIAPEMVAKLLWMFFDDNDGVQNIKSGGYS